MLLRTLKRAITWQTNQDRTTRINRVISQANQGSKSKPTPESNSPVKAPRATQGSKSKPTPESNSPVKAPRANHSSLAKTAEPAFRPVWQNAGRIQIGT
jgi:hypothetical protein